MEQLIRARDVSSHRTIKPQGLEWRNCPELVTSRLIELSNRTAKSGQLCRAHNVSSHRIIKPQGQEWGNCPELVTSRLIKFSNRKAKSGATVQSS